MQIIKSLVWSVALYAAETWMLMQADRSKLESFEVCIWRRMEKISCVDKKTNEESLNAWFKKIENIKHNMVIGVVNINGWHDVLHCDILEERTENKR